MSSSTWPILSVLMWLPIAGGLAMFLLGDKGIALGRWVALITTAVTFGISTLLWTSFDATTAQMQFVERLTWLPRCSFVLRARRRRLCDAAHRADGVHHAAGR